MKKIEIRALPPSVPGQSLLPIPPPAGVGFAVLTLAAINAQLGPGSVHPSGAAP